MFGYNTFTGYPGILPDGNTPGGLVIAGGISAGGELITSSSVGVSNLQPGRLLISRFNDAAVALSVNLASGSSGPELVMQDSLGAAVWELDADGTESLAGSLAAFGVSPPAVKPVVTGSRGGNAGLAALLTALASLGFITNSTTA